MKPCILDKDTSCRPDGCFTPCPHNNNPEFHIDRLMGDQEEAEE